MMPHILQHRGGVITLAVHAVRIADDHADAADLGGHVGQRALAGGAEIITQKQILRRISAQGEFRGEEKIGAARFGAVGMVEDFSRVAGEISDRTVDLANRDAHGCYYIIRSFSK